MIRILVAILAFAFAVNLVYMQDILCSWIEDPSCVATSAFSIENVHQLRSRAVQEAEFMLEAAWHESEPILIGLAKSWNRTTNILLYWRFEDYSSGTETIKQEVRLSQGETFAQLAVTSDKIIVGTDSGSLMNWNLADGEFLYEFPATDGPITEVLLHPSKTWLAVVSDSSELFQADLELKSSAKIHLEGSNTQALEALAFSSDGRLFAAAGQGAIRVWNTESWDTWEPHPLSSASIAKLLFTDEDSRLIVLADASVSRWSLIDERLVFVRVLQPHASQLPCNLKDGDISLDGSLLMTIDDCDQYRAWDWERNREVFIPQLLGSRFDDVGSVLEFSPDGRYLVGASSDRAWLNIFFVFDDELTQ